MRFTKYCILLLSILLIACSNDDNETTSTTDAALEIIDYNPKQTFTAEEIIIQTTAIDSTANIEIDFSGTKTSSYRIEGNTISVKRS